MPITRCEIPRIAPLLKKNKRNYYRILHVQPDAPFALIQASYRTLMQTLRNHPDLGGDEWNAATLNQAYAVLSDEQQRRTYDAQLFANRPPSESGRQTSAQRSADYQAPRHPENEFDHSPGARRAYGTPTSGVACEPRRGYQVDLVDSLSCAFCGTTFSGVLDSETDCVRCMSPLDPHRPLSLESSNQRRVRRVPITQPLALHTAWPGPSATAHLHDLSPNGFQFSAVEDLHPGQRVRVSCSAFIAVAEITNKTRSSVGQLRYGAKFVTLRYCGTSGAHFSASI